MQVVLIRASGAPQIFSSSDMPSRQLSAITNLFLSEFQRYSREPQVEQINQLLEQYFQVIQERSITSRIEHVNDPVQRKAAVEDLNAARVGLRAFVASPEIRNNASLAPHVLKIETAIQEIDSAIKKMEKIEEETRESHLKKQKEAPTLNYMGRPGFNNLLGQQAINNERMSAISRSNKDTLKTIDRQKEQNKKEIQEFYEKQDRKARLDQAVAQQVTVAEVISVY